MKSNRLIQCCSIIVLWAAFSGTAFSQILLFQEDPFFGIPGLESLNESWFVMQSDSNDSGLKSPVDLAILRLSSSDFRQVVLDAVPPFFTVFEINQSDSLTYAEISRSIYPGELDDPNFKPSAMAVVKTGNLFNPSADHIAVTDYGTGDILLFDIDTNDNSVHFVRRVVCETLVAPIGLYYSGGKYFVSDETAQRVVMLDSAGTELSAYGQPGYAPNCYAWISALGGFTDSMEVVHLFVADGENSRVDLLELGTETNAISAKSQIWCRDSDSLYLSPQAVNAVPGVGIVACDMARQVLLIWPELDTLTSNGRIDVPIDTAQLEGRVLKFKQAGGRLIFLVARTDQTFSLISCGLGSILDELHSHFENPEPRVVVLPTEYKLYQNYPNPFNPTTQIEFDLPDVSDISIRIFNTLGQEVATIIKGSFNAGHYVVTWNGKSNAGIDVATGLYIYQLKAGSFLDTKKMILMR